MAFRLGVLMLENRFPRPVGDIGNVGTFPFEVIYDRVAGARIEKIATGNGLAPELVQAFAQRAKALEQQDCDLITTGCGFLLPHQHELSIAVNVPVVTSSLCVLPYLRSIRPAGKPIGILTYDATKLIPTMADEDTEGLVIEGIEGGSELHHVIAEDRDTLDFAAARNDVAAAATRLAAKAGNMFAVVLECTNLPPYRDAIEDVVDCPIYDIRDLVHWHAGLARPA